MSSKSPFHVGHQLCALLMLAALAGPFSWGAEPIGSDEHAGCANNPRRVDRLFITEPGTYENILVDGDWTDRTLVKITADDVVLRHCEVRNGKHNAVLVMGKNVVIDSCKIHHVLAGTFADQKDAHGITGQPHGLVIRNCDIGMVSGDAIQFDPGRREWGEVVVDRCTLWTAPLESDMAGFNRGERPGENGVDTKQLASNPRSSMTIRSCLIQGWKQPGQIGHMAGLNLKNHVRVTVENCVLRDNEICFRLRGGEGEVGGAAVTINRCAVYESGYAVRIEDRIRDLKIKRLGIGTGVGKVIENSGGGAGSGFENSDSFQAPAAHQVLREGISAN